MAYGDDNVISADLSTSGFVPDLWMDEIQAAHKKNVVLAALVRKLNVKGKRGDSIKLPKPARGSASAKAPACHRRRISIPMAPRCNGRPIMR